MVLDAARNGGSRFGLGTEDDAPFFDVGAGNIDFKACDAVDVEVGCDLSVFFDTAGGDIDEDGVDSKISCTELTILKRLTKKELFLHGLAFMADHPKRKWNSNIKADKAEAWNGYAAVRGADPIAKGTRNGDVLAFAKEDGTTGGIQQIVVAEIDGKTLQPGIWYGVELEKGW